jgi:branched-chain amino acid transport system permease protein
MISAYIIHLLIIIGIWIILVASLNIALGYTGLLNLGHVAFFAIGAYTSALLVKAGVHFVLAFIAAGIFAGFCGFGLMYATRKLKGDYLALATLGFAYIVGSILINWTDVTQGARGIPGIPKPSFLGYSVSSNIAYLIFVSVICIVSLLMMWRIVKSPFGKLLQACRDDALGLRVLGKNTFALQWKAMAISAFFAGIAGSLYAHYITFIDPTSFHLEEIILMLTILIVGGIASLRGSIVATFVIILIPELLRFLSLPSAILGPMRHIIYAIILLSILLYKPRGLFGRIDLQ